MERRSVDRQDVGKEYTLTEYPKELQKKITLLQHFRSYLEGGDNKGSKGKDEEDKKIEEVVEFPK